MPRKPKRARPKTRQDRARVHEINRLLRTRGGLNPGERASLEAEKNRLSPVLALSRPDLEAWMGRIEAARESGSLSGVQGEKKEGISDRSPVSPQSKPAETEKDFVQNQKDHLAALVPGTHEHDAAIAWCSIPAAPEVREAAVRRYWTEHGKRETERLLADPVRRRNNAALHVASTTDNKLRDHARKFADGLSCDENNLGTWGSVAERRENAFTRLLWEVLTWNRSFPHPSADPKWSADIFAEVDRRDLEDAERFRRVLETPPQSQTVEVRLNKPVAEPFEAGSGPEPTDGEIKKMATRMPPGAPAPVSPEPKPVLDPIVSASMDLAQRVNLILQTDSFLRDLAQVNFELNEKIRGALTAELLRVGHIQGSFAATLFNSLRQEYKIFRLAERRF